MHKVERFTDFPYLLFPPFPAGLPGQNTSFSRKTLEEVSEILHIFWRRRERRRTLENDNPSPQDLCHFLRAKGTLFDFRSFLEKSKTLWPKMGWKLCSTIGRREYSMGNALEGLHGEDKMGWSFLC
jgi:hypothetical protein